MEESRNEFGRKTGKSRSKKLNTRVDLTAMVSVSFLLIVFFMVTNELSKDKFLSLNLPDNQPVWDGIISCGDENRTLTLLLGDNDKITTYRGILAVPIQAPKEVKYGKDGIRKELFFINKKVHEYSAALGKSGRGVTVIIKPSKKCHYKNLVDILDEMAIADISSYVIVNDFTPEEAQLLALK
jgi:biopolymer transport protein ExbD